MKENLEIKPNNSLSLDKSKEVNTISEKTESKIKENLKKPGKNIQQRRESRSDWRNKAWEYYLNGTWTYEEFSKFHDMMKTY